MTDGAGRIAGPRLPVAAGLEPAIVDYPPETRRPAAWSQLRLMSPLKGRMNSQ